MSEQHSLGLLGLEVGWILVPLGFLPDLLGDLLGELFQEQGSIRLGDEGAVEEPAQHLAGLLSHLYSLVTEKPGGEGDLRCGVTRSHDRRRLG